MNVKVCLKKSKKKKQENFKMDWSNGAVYGLLVVKNMCDLESEI